MELVSEVESLGGMAQCLTTRDYILYFIDVLQEHSDRAVELMAETILHPLFPGIYMCVVDRINLLVPLIDVNMNDYHFSKLFVCISHN